LLTPSGALTLATVSDAEWKVTTTMQTQRSRGVEQQHQAKERLIAELRAWERQLVLRSLNEAIRLIESDKFEKLNGQHIQCIAEYDAITIDGESFFDKAFTSGKEVAACLAFAMEIGWREALDDMMRLRMTLLGPDAGTVAGTLGTHEAECVGVASRSAA
jgi:hypothetical protein